MTKAQAIALNQINHFIGLENIVRELDRFTSHNTVDRYPPHNVIKVEDNKYVVELATAGFTLDELSVVVEDKVLKISGKQNRIDESTVEYLTKGISTKSFEKTIPLIDTVEVQGAEYVNGILKIALENIIPESKKPKSIPILGKAEQKLLNE